MNKMYIYIQTHTVPSQQGTLAKHAKPTLKPNFAKEPFCILIRKWLRNPVLCIPPVCLKTARKYYKFWKRFAIDVEPNVNSDLVKITDISDPKSAILFTHNPIESIDKLK